MRRYIPPFLRPVARAVRARLLAALGAHEAPPTVVEHERPEPEPEPEPEPRPSLNEIGLATGTDKSSEIHNYLDVYESLLGHLRDEEFELIEIGVHQGSSVRMWERYFERARIVGVDIKDSCREFATKRIEILIGNQADQRFTVSLAKFRHPMVVIDDGSHRWTHQISTFRTLWPAVLPGGYFIVEDIHTSFGAGFAKTYGNPDGPTAFDYVAKIAMGIVAGPQAKPPADDFEAHCRATVESVVMMRHSVVFKKKRHPQPWFMLSSVAEEAAQPWTRDLGPAYDRIESEVVGASPEVTDDFADLVRSGPVTFEPAASGELSNVTVFGFGPTVTADGKILAETLNGAREAHVRRTSHLYRPYGDRHWILDDDLHPEDHPVRVDGKRYVLLKQTWDRNFGHWLVDVLPRIGLLDGQFDLADCVFVVNRQTTDGMRAVVRDSLAMAGVAEDQIMELGVGMHRFEKLVVPSAVSEQPRRKAPFAIRFLEKLGEQVPPEGSSRIYLSRNNYPRRRLLNEDDVVKVLAEYGYAVVSPEKLSFREQVALFRGATHVAGNMGASMSSLAFSPHGVSVLALATETMHHDFFYDLVCHKNGRYRGLQGTAVTEHGAEPGNGSDFVVDLDLFAQQLAWLHRLS